MRSAAVLAFSGLAAAGLIPSPVYEVPAQETEYSTVLVTVTSCEPDAVTDCPAESTVISSSVVPYTTSTIYETKVYTITDCPEEVTDCPATSGSSVVVTETIAVSTTVCPIDEPTETPYVPTYPPVEEPSKTYEVPEESSPVYEEPSKGYPEPSKGYPEPSKGYPEPPKTTDDVIPTQPPAEELCPTESVKTIVYSTEITTVVPTVLTKYETATLEVPCPEPTTSKVQVPPPAPSAPGNATIPYPPPPAESSDIPAGAAGISGSVFVAAAAAIAAYAFA